MRSLTCIVCPIGCALSVEEDAAGELKLSGNRCPRGAVYAEEEIRSPKRVVTATCRLGPAVACREQDSRSAGLRLRRHGMCDPRRLPVKTSVPCPKERIGELLSDIYGLQVDPPVAAGTVVLADWKGTGIDVVAVRALD